MLADDAWPFTRISAGGNCIEDHGLCRWRSIVRGTAYHSPTLSKRKTKVLLDEPATRCRSRSVVGGRVPNCLSFPARQRSLLVGRGLRHTKRTATPGR